MLDVPAFWAWPAAPNVGVILPFFQRSGPLQPLSDGSPDLQFLARDKEPNLPKMAGINVLLTYI
jgi:hypothetical protein